MFYAYFQEKEQEKEATLTAGEMTNFINTVRNSTFTPDLINKDALDASVKIQKRTQEFVGQQHD